MKIMIIGATGTVGGAVRQELLQRTNVDLVLSARSVGRLRDVSDREQVLPLDATDYDQVVAALDGVDAVFVAVSGQLPKIAQTVVKAMDAAHVKRLAFITSMGIYNEIPASVGSGNLNSNPVLRPYRQAADIVSASDLNYTVVRPGWYVGGTSDFQITQENEPFGGHDVSVSALASFCAQILQSQTAYAKQSVGINNVD